MMHFFILAILTLNKILIRLLPLKIIVCLYSNAKYNTNDVALHAAQITKGLRIRNDLEDVINSSTIAFVCYEQALTVLFLSRIYRIPVTMSYGIKKDGDTIKAHAWTRIGETFISGYNNIDEYNSIFEIMYTPSSMRDSKNPMARGLYLVLKPLYKLIKFTVKFISDPNYRSIQYNLMLKSEAIHQTTTYTSMDRYPAIFKSVRTYFSNKEQLKILSFGCSTGEEVVTLRSYFPEAFIVGSDINKECLKGCRKKINDENVRFIYSTPSLIEAHGPYDAIFCMAVLQRLPHKVLNEGITNIEKLYPFSKFEEQLIELDNQLNLNGVLIVHFTQYNFLDVSIAFKYRPIDSVRQVDYPTPIFDKNGQLVEGVEQYYSIFIKTSN